MLSIVPLLMTIGRAMAIKEYRFKIIARGKYMQDQSEKPMVLADLQINSGTMLTKNKSVKEINIKAKASVKDLDINN